MISTTSTEIFGYKAASGQGRFGESRTILQYDYRQLAVKRKWYPLASLRLNPLSAASPVKIRPVSFSIAQKEQKDFAWAAFVNDPMNPIIKSPDGAQWQDFANSRLQYDLSRGNTNTIIYNTNLVKIGGTGANKKTKEENNNVNAIWDMGTNLEGSPYELVLGFYPLQDNADVLFAINFSELI